MLKHSGVAHGSKRGEVAFKAQLSVFVTERAILFGLTVRAERVLIERQETTRTLSVE